MASKLSDKLVGVSGLQRFRFYGSYAMKEARRSLCTYCIGLLSCFVVIVATGLVDVLVNNFPMLYLQLAQDEGYTADAVLVTKQLSQEPSIFRTQPFLNISRIDEVLKSDLPMFVDPGPINFSYLDKNKMWDPLLVPAIDFPDAVLFSNCHFNSTVHSALIQSPYPFLHEQSLGGQCRQAVDVELQTASFDLRINSGRVSGRFPNINMDDFPSNAILIGDQTAWHLNVREGSKLILSFHMDLHLKSIATHLYLQSLLPGARGWGTESYPSTGRLSRERFEDIIRALGDFSDLRAEVQVAAVLESKNGMIKNKNLGNSLYMNADKFDDFLFERIEHAFDGRLSSDKKVRASILDPYLLMYYPEVKSMLLEARNIFQKSSKNKHRKNQSLLEEYSTSIEAYISKSPQERQTVLFKGLQNNIQDLRADLITWKTAVFESKLGFLTVGVVKVDMIEYIINTFEYLASLIGTVLNIAVFSLYALSVLLVYSLLLISVESSTLKLGILRMVGFPRARLAELIVCQALFYVLPAIIFGLIALGAISKPTTDILQNVIMGQLSKVSVPNALTFVAVLKQIFIGLSIPIVSSIIPVRQAFKHNIRDALDMNRSKPGFLEKDEDDAMAPPSQVRVSRPLLIVGALMSIIGFSVYYGLPVALFAGNIALMAVVFLGILVGFIAGMVLLALNLQKPLCHLLVLLFLFWESLQMRAMVLRNLVNHSSRNRKTSLMYCGCLAGCLFIYSSWNVYTAGEKIDDMMYDGGDAKMNIYDSISAINVLKVIDKEIKKGKEESFISDYTVKSTIGNVIQKSNYIAGSAIPSKSPEIVLSTLSNYKTTEVTITAVPPNFFDVTETAAHISINKLTLSAAEAAVEDIRTGRKGSYFFTYDKSRFSETELMQSTTAARIKQFFQQGEKSLPLARALLAGLYSVRGSGEVIPSCSALDMVKKRIPSWWSQGREEHSMIVSVKGFSDVHAVSGRFRNAGCIRKAGGLRMGSTGANLSSLSSQDLLMSYPAMLQMSKAIGLNRQSLFIPDSISISVRRNAERGVTAKQLKSLIELWHERLTFDGMDAQRIFRKNPMSTGINVEFRYFYDFEQKDGQLSNAISFVFGALIAILLILCFFSLSASMNANIADSAKEMAILRSLGLTKLQVAIVPVYEAFLLVASSSILGITVGIIVGWSMVAQKTIFSDTNVKMVLPWAAIACVIFSSFLAAVLASLIPAYRLLNKHSVAGLNKLTA